MKRNMLLSTVIALSSLTIAAGPAPTLWNVDAPHTGIGFSVNHFFTPVEGKFDDYDIELTYDREHPENSTVRASIDVASVNTGNERRDAHLKSADFFDAETYPVITFTSTSVRKVSEGHLVASGPLEIRGHARDIELPITVLGVKDIPTEMREMLGGVAEIASFETGLDLIRGDFGVGTGSWAANLVVGDEVAISITVEANRE